MLGKIVSNSHSKGGLLFPWWIGLRQLPHAVGECSGVKPFLTVYAVPLWAGFLGGEFAPSEPPAGRTGPRGTVLRYCVPPWAVSSPKASRLWSLVMVRVLVNEISGRLGAGQQLNRYSPYWESSGSKGTPNEMVAS